MYIFFCQKKNNVACSNIDYCQIKPNSSLRFIWFLCCCYLTKVTGQKFYYYLSPYSIVPQKSKRIGVDRRIYIYIFRWHAWLMSCVYEIRQLLFFLHNILISDHKSRSDVRNVIDDNERYISNLTSVQFLVQQLPVCF